MSYNTGTIVSATQPAKDLMDTLGSIIEAHAAWEFVEEVVGTGTRVSKVYRCLGAANGFGSDFYVALVRISLTGMVGLIAGETYDSVTKTFGHGCVYDSATATPIDSSMGYATPRHVANEHTLVGITPGFLKLANTGNNTNTTGFTYFIIVTPKMVAFTTSGTGFAAVVSHAAGLYERFHNETLDPFPLFVISPSDTSGTGSTSRATGLTPSASYPYPFSIKSSLWSYGIVPDSATSLEKISGGHCLSRLALHYPYPIATSPRTGAVPGRLYPQILSGQISNASEAVNDYVVVNGVTYRIIAAEVGGARTTYFAENA